MRSGQLLATPGAHQPSRRAQAHRHPRQLVAHGAVHDGGSARIACPRIQLCTMTIAWPQRLQTNAGCAALDGPSACPSLRSAAWSATHRVLPCTGTPDRQWARAAGRPRGNTPEQQIGRPGAAAKVCTDVYRLKVGYSKLQDPFRWLTEPSGEAKVVKE